MRYKVFIVQKDKKSPILKFVEADFGNDYAFDTEKDAHDAIERRGESFVPYVILPYVYMTD